MRCALKVMAGFALAFVAVEAALRLLGFPSVNTNTFDEHGLVIFKPNQSFLVKDRCYASVLRSNAEGFHARDYAVDKPAGVYRIALLGDSFVEAVQVPVEKSFPYLLEQKLNQGAAAASSSRRYEVIPFGKSGNGALVNAQYLRRYALKYRPDLVIEAFVTNDLEDDAKLGAGEPAAPTGSPLALALKHFFLERSLAFERWWMNLAVIRSQWAAKSASPRGLAATSTPPSRLDSFVEAQTEPQSGGALNLWANEERSLKALDALAEESGAKFLLVQLAEGYLIDPPELQVRYRATPQEAARFSPDLARQKLATMAARAGYPFFSAVPYFAQAFKITGTLPIYPCDNHYNELGHQEMAEALYGYLRDSMRLR
ncbi:MAG TPA: hypothetical protein VFQ72_02710 [Candidatus Paceibacterota bacterium]|nr:hypothetical protein [Candidatus Paceibacterota bacterium]